MMWGELAIDEAEVDAMEGATECGHCAERGRPYFASYRDYWRHVREAGHSIFEKTVEGNATIYGRYHNNDCHHYTPYSEMSSKGLKNWEAGDPFTSFDVDELFRDAEVWWMRVQRHGLFREEGREGTDQTGHDPYAGGGHVRQHVPELGHVGCLEEAAGATECGVRDSTQAALEEAAHG